MYAWHKKVLVVIAVLSAKTMQSSFISFDVAMNMQSFANVLMSQEHEKYFGVSGEYLYNFFRDLYERMKHNQDVSDASFRIPKIIHQIWIGNSVPEKFKSYQNSWKLYHPDWEYRLWTQKDIESMEWYNAELIHQSRNPGEISDIMRYEILYHYGGVYIDMDFECLAPLNDLHKKYDFYIGIQPLDSGLVQLGIGIIGSIPGHPLLLRAMTQLRESYYNLAHKGNAPARTGPLYFTKIFYSLAGKTTQDIALPAIYCYPLACQGTELLYDEWRLLGAFGVHHWAKSWLLPDFRKPEFRNLGNE